MSRARMLATSALVLAGCTCEPPPPPPPASAPAPQVVAAPSAPQVYEVTIASAPTGAKVVLQGAELGTTPYVLKFKTQTSLMVEADGYVAREVTVGPDSEPTVVVTLTPMEGGAAATGGALPASPSDASAPASGTAPAKDATRKPKPTTASGSAPAEPPATPPAAPTSPPKSSLPYDNVADAKSDYQAGKIDRDAYDQAVRKLKVRRAGKIEEIKALYQKGAIDKSEYQQRKRVIDNEYRGE